MVPDDSYLRFKAEDLNFHAKKKFLSAFQALIEKSYLLLKKDGKLKKDKDGFVNGFMGAGIEMGIVSNDDLQKVIDKIHIKVFGKTYEERQALLKSKKMSEAELDRPTFERLGKHLDE